MKVFRCPNCNDIVFRQRRDLVIGDMLNNHTLEPIQGHSNGDKLACKKCRHEFGMGQFARPHNWTEEVMQSNDAAQKNGGVKNGQ